MVQSIYTQLPQAGYPGSLYDSWAVEKGNRFTLINAPVAAKQTVGTMTVVKGANAGAYTYQVIGTAPNGNAVNIIKTYNALAGDDLNIVANNLVSLVNNDDVLNDFLSLTQTGGVITTTVIPSNSNPVTSIAGTASGSGNSITASPAVTNYAANGIIYYGYALGQYGQAQVNQSQLTGGTCSPITTASNLTIVGIAIEAKAAEFVYPYSNTAQGGWLPNEAVPYAPVGSGIRIWVPVLAAVTSGTVPGVSNSTGQLTTTGSGTALTGATYISDQAVAGLTALVQL
ncbi:MAG: hypothetical protein KME45_03515 [Stenomitos rutilans HA7619-LM2]|jgi:hypothetical protein|nr:hypothetical protein [Stenomitos rutilans HA7619-LM2]MBW4469454.1 hypothetical protein [Stenomitos rutilans HA7619-LM2]